MDCQESLCTSCSDVSHRLKALRNHTVTDVVSHESNTRKDRDTTKIISQFLSCPRHPDKIITLICKDDDSLCCLSCSLDDKMKGMNLVEIESIVENEEAEREADGLVIKLGKLATLSEAIITTKSTTEAENKTETENIMTEIRDMRTKMNTVFDHLENNVGAQCKALTKKYTITALEDNAKLQDTMASIKESLSVLKQTKLHGSKSLLYVILHHLKRKLKKHENTLLEMKNQCRKFSFKLEVQDTLLNSLAIGPNETDTLACITETEHAVTLPDYSERFLLKHCKICQVSKYKIHVQDTTFDPSYVGLVSLPDNRLVVIDNNNGLCCLVHGNQVIGSCKLTPTTTKKGTTEMTCGQPCGISFLKNEMVVVSVPDARKLYFLSVSDGVKISCEFDTAFKPLAVQGLKSGEIAVSSVTPSAFRILRFNGYQLQERLCLDHDNNGRVFRGFFFMAIDEERSHVLQSCYIDKKLYCFDFEGNAKFSYSNSDIKFNAGVELDTDGNIYLCDVTGASIHIVSPEGDAIRQVKDSTICPFAIHFKQDTLEFIVTNMNDKRCPIIVYKLTK